MKPRDKTVLFNYLDSFVEDGVEEEVAFEVPRKVWKFNPSVEVQT
jgi:hypothetical protein